MPTPSADAATRAKSTSTLHQTHASPTQLNPSLHRPPSILNGRTVAPTL